MQWFKKLFQRKPRIMQDKEHKFIEAFELHGIRYFQFEDAFSGPTQRMMCALTYYAELEMRLDRSYIEAHCKMVDKILNPEDGKIKLTILALLNNNMKERLALTPFPDHIYKLASVIFFDDSEDPYGYDQKYNEKKIAKWKKADGVLDFFLKQPLKELIPSLASVDMNVQMFFDVAQKIDELHRSDLQENLYSN